VNIEVEFPFKIVGAKLAKTDKSTDQLAVLGHRAEEGGDNALCFVPGNDVRTSNLVHPCEECEEGEQYGSDN
jgi:hypothetical protein